MPFVIRVRPAVLAACLAGLAACSRQPATQPVPLEPRTAATDTIAAAPTLPALDIVGAGRVTPAGTPDSASRRITITSVNADARTLLLAIAREAGISLVVSDDVRRRVSVSLTDARPDDAIAAIVAQAGLTIARPPSPAFAPVVYYQLPVNVNEAPAEAIAARFGVSLELARFLAASRSPDQP